MLTQRSPTTNRHGYYSTTGQRNADGVNEVIDKLRPYVLRWNAYFGLA